MSRCEVITQKARQCQNNAKWYVVSNKRIKHSCSIHAFGYRFKTLEEAQLELLRRQL